MLALAIVDRTGTAREQIIEHLDDGTLTITPNRPDRLNARTATMARALISVFDRAAHLRAHVDDPDALHER